MPLKACKIKGKTGIKWGDAGKCYTYTPGSKSSKTKAKKKALAQAVAMGEFKHADYEKFVERNMPKRELNTADPSKMDFRCLQLRASSLSQEDRSIEADIATETPVEEWDWTRGERVPRVLLASGAVFPRGKQIPLLDSHSRHSLQNQLGSIRKLRKEASSVVGTLVFSSAAEDAFAKVREGHVTDVSAGFEVLAEEYIPRGETRKIEGKTFKGPINVATRWLLREGSVVPIGADEAAKMRGLDPAIVFRNKETLKVNPELRKRCIEAGMDASLTDEQAMEWLNNNHARVFTPTPAPTPAPAPAPVPAPAPTAVDPAAIAASVSRSVLDEIERREQLRAQQQREQREAFERDVQATLVLMYDEETSIPADVRTACLGFNTMDQVRAHLATVKKAQQELSRLNGGYIQPTGSQRDAHRGALRTAYMMRSFNAAFNGQNLDRILPTEQRAQGFEQFSGMRLVDLARECLMADGYSYHDLRMLSPENIAKAAMGWPEKVGLRSAGYAYHTTGSLAVITQDAINKTLLAAYNEAPQTWRGPMRQAASVADFKQIHRIKMSAVANLPVWLDNSAPNQAAISNEEEKYAVEARALMLTFSWRLLVNDDMDALARTPSLMGRAAARTVNNVAWASMLANPTMADGQTLFLATPTGARFRSNLTTGSASPTVATNGAMRNKMRQMRGLNTPEGTEGSDILNLTPTYIVGPTALETTILQLVLSTADPASSGNSGIYNPSRTLTPVFEPLLDANSTTAWYLFASPADIDTVEVTFLQGQETPVTNDFVDEKTLSRSFSIIQTYAARPIDFRGIQKHAGA